VIDTLGHAMAELRGGAVALKAENADLRATNQRLCDRPGAPADIDLTEVRLQVDARAPAAARAVVSARLRHALTAATFDRAQLLTSELVSNAVLHSGVDADATLVFRLAVAQSEVRLEVEDPGHRGAVAPRAPDHERGGGFGLNLVQQLSERWGLERVTAGGTRVWAHVAFGAPATLPSATS
jgi:anti-sigma regulatory factor (Ser/Thr protein kinase)